MQFVERCDPFVLVRNLSPSNTFLHQHHTYELTPQEAPLQQRFRVKFAPGWDAGEGDELEVIASLPGHLRGSTVTTRWREATPSSSRPDGSTERRSAGGASRPGACRCRNQLHAQGVVPRDEDGDPLAARPRRGRRQVLVAGLGPELQAVVPEAIAGLRVAAAHPPDAGDDQAPAPFAEEHHTGVRGELEDYLVGRWQPTATE